MDIQFARQGSRQSNGSSACKLQSGFTRVHHSHFSLLLAIATLTFWLQPAADASEANPADRTNVLFIAIDALNDWVGFLAGHPQAVTPHMIAQGSGSIVNMTSPASVHGLPNGSVYAAIKGAISALTRQCAVELGQKGIRVNAVAPGPMPTPGTMSVVDEQGWEKRLATSPLGRLSTPEGVAKVVVFLASDAADCVNGDVLFADGGRSISKM